MPSPNVIASIMRLLGHASGIKDEGIPYLRQFGHAADTLDNMDAGIDELTDVIRGGTKMKRMGLPAVDDARNLRAIRSRLIDQRTNRANLEQAAQLARRRIMDRQKLRDIDFGPAAPKGEPFMPIEIRMGKGQVRDQPGYVDDFPDYIAEEERMAAKAELRAMQKEDLMRKAGLGGKLDKEYDDLVNWFRGFQRNQKVQERLQSLSRDSSNTESALNKLMYRIHRNKK